MTLMLPVSWGLDAMLRPGSHSPEARAWPLSWPWRLRTPALFSALKELTEWWGHTGRRYDGE